MKYKLIVSDYDGTLGKGSKVDGQTLAAINGFIARGGKFSVCSGRLYQSVTSVCKENGIGGVVIACQGASIYDLSTGKRLLSGGLPAETAVKILEYLIENGLDVFIVIDDVLYYYRESVYLNRYLGTHKVQNVKVDDLCALIRRENKPVMKVEGMAEPEIANNIKDVINAKFGDEVVANSGVSYVVEVVDRRYTKKTSVKFLADYYGVPLSEVLTVGDSTNDIELMGGEWHGVAVGDASEELKKAAKEVTVPFDEHPVAYLIEKYCR